MTLLDKLDRRFGRYAVENATLYLVLGQGFVYLADAGGQQLTSKTVLIPDLVMRGEVWRLFTYVVTPPAVHPLWILIYLSAFYFFGRTVEAVWGAFRYNAYLLVGFVATAAAAFAAPETPAFPFYAKSSVFLAFATLLPDFTIRVYMLLPVQAKWLAALTWALYGYAFYWGGLSTRLMIAAAVTNYFLFFAGAVVRGAKQAHRKRAFQQRAKPKKIAHECRVCGLTQEMAPKTAFRYCSQCEGMCCYCPDHIKNHEHVTKDQA
ncbi:MAG: hypothetical protein AAF790_11725 [Planctomycetota bacterium]